MPRRPRTKKCERWNAKAFGFTYSCPVAKDDNPIASCEELKELFVKMGGFIHKYVGPRHARAELAYGTV